MDSTSIDSVVPDYTKSLVQDVKGLKIGLPKEYFVKGMDPEVCTAGGTGGSGATGIDYCSVPSVRTYTFGVNITF